MRELVRLAALPVLGVGLTLALTAAACGTGGGGNDSCDDVHEYEVRIAEPPPPAYADEMAACVMYFKRCVDVCSHVLADMGLPNEYVECLVRHDATGHDVTVGVEVPCPQ